MVVARDAAVLIAASVAGESHVRAGVECQDRAATGVCPDGTLVAAVADGLGSAALAGDGAEIAVNAAVEAARAAGALALTDLVVAMAGAARRALEEAAAEEGCALRDLACTLLTVAMREDGAAAAHVGDGAVVAATPDGLVALSEPAESEYVNEVEPLTSDSWRGALRVRALDGVSAVGALTDGCHRAGFRADGEPHSGFFDPLFAYAASRPHLDEARAELEALLGGAKMAEHSDDDKTLVLLIPAG